MKLDYTNQLGKLRKKNCNKKGNKDPNQMFNTKLILYSNKWNQNNENEKKANR